MTNLSNVGHHFIIGLSGPTLTDLDKKILSGLKPSGILFLKRNFLPNTPYHEWLGAFASLQAAIREYTERDKMFFSLDHEGGRVHRTPSPITQFATPSDFKGDSFAVGKAMAIELRSIGVNVSWSPSVDIHSNPNNPVIGTRAFGTTAKSVTEYAGAFMRGLLENGVMACIKHFPGHGDTSIDSHFALPRLDKQLDELKQFELIPFVNLINQGAPMVMTSHILFSHIDYKPATLSRIFLEDILRKELGFGGVVVSDDLDMKAVSDLCPNDSLATEAIRAGCELCIVARHPDGSSDKPLLLARALQEAIRGDGDLEKKSLSALGKIEYLLSNAIGHYNPRELTARNFADHQSSGPVLAV